MSIFRYSSSVGTNGLNWPNSDEYGLLLFNYYVTSITAEFPVLGCNRPGILGATRLRGLCT